VKCSYASMHGTRELARLRSADGGGACGRHSVLGDAFVESSSTFPASEQALRGESLDPLGRATSFLLWSVALMILLPSVLLHGLDSCNFAVDGQR
jgi:hypothetical protein